MIIYPNWPCNYPAIKQGSVSSSETNDKTFNYNFAFKTFDIDDPLVYVPQGTIPFPKDLAQKLKEYILSGKVSVQKLAIDQDHF